MYIVDTSIFYTLGPFYPANFPSLWERIDTLVANEDLKSVREVRREIEGNCPYEHIEQWVQDNRPIFRKPNSDEMRVVSDIFKRAQFRGLVKRTNLVRGLPVADPFLVASAKIHGGVVLTQESLKKGGARVPTVCKEFGVECINLEDFFRHEKLRF